MLQSLQNKQPPYRFATELLSRSSSTPYNNYKLCRSCTNPKKAQRILSCRQNLSREEHF